MGCSWAFGATPAFSPLPSSLRRDCICYAIALITLAIFFGGTSPDVIEWWEALILLSLYFGYVLVMKNNQKLYSIVSKATRRRRATSLFADQVR